MTDAPNPAEAAISPVSELKSATIRGLVWMGGAQVVRQLLQLVIAVVLGRMLYPGDFGLIGMVSAFMGFATLLTDLGLGAALIQRPNIREAHLSTAFWINLAAGAVLSTVALAMGPLLADFFGEPRLSRLTAVLGLTLFIGSASVVPRALASRSMSFRRLSMVDLGSVAVGGVAAIAAAVADAGYWSLAVQALVTTGCSTVAISVWMGWRPRLALESHAARELWKFGAGQTGFTAINYWARNADDILIGRFVGPAELGLYPRAYQLMRLPLMQVSQVVGRVMFPAMARMQSDHRRVRRVYLDAVSAIALVAFPLMTGLAAASPELVPGVLGSRWSGAVVLLQILAVAGVPQSVGLTVGWIYQSQGRTDVMLRWGVGATALALLAFAIGVRWGAVGVAERVHGAECGPGGVELPLPRDG